MNVLQIVTQMEAAGAQTAAIKLHQRWLSDNKNVRTLFLYEKTNAFKNIDCVDILNKNKPNNLFSAFFFFISLYKYIRAHRPTTIICHTSYSNIIGSIVAYIAGVRNINVVHHGLFNINKKISNFIDLMLGILPIYRRIICVSNSVAHSYKKHPSRYRKKISVIHNGLEKPDFLLNTVYCYVRNEDYINLVSVGRLHPQKNQQLLLEIVKANSKLRLFLVGEGDLRRDFEHYIEFNDISDRVQLFGELSSSDVFSIINYADIFVFPSKSEAFGLSLLEAMLLGKPVITSDLPCFIELLGEDAFFLKSEELSDWLKYFNKEFSLNKISNDEQLSLARASKFSFENMFEKYEGIIE